MTDLQTATTHKALRIITFISISYHLHLCMLIFPALIRPSYGMAFGALWIPELAIAFLFQLWRSPWAE